MSLSFCIIKYTQSPDVGYLGLYEWRHYYMGGKNDPLADLSGSKAGTVNQM